MRRARQGRQWGHCPRVSSTTGVRPVALKRLSRAGLFGLYISFQRIEVVCFTSSFNPFLYCFFFRLKWLNYGDDEAIYHVIVKYGKVDNLKYTVMNSGSWCLDKLQFGLNL